MKTTLTPQSTRISAAEIKKLGTKIYALRAHVGNSQFPVLKAFNYKSLDGSESVYVITRDGILNFFGDAQKAAIYGKKGVDYIVFKSASKAADFINKYEPTK